MSFFAFCTRCFDYFAHFDWTIKTPVINQDSKEEEKANVGKNVEIQRETSLESYFTHNANSFLCVCLGQVKKYFELEPLARGKRWILEGSSTDHMDAVKEVFGHFISLLEDKDTEPAGRIWLPLPPVLRVIRGHKDVPRNCWWPEHMYTHTHTHTLTWSIDVISLQHQTSSL